MKVQELCGLSNKESSCCSPSYEYFDYIFWIAGETEEEEDRIVGIIEKFEKDEVVVEDVEQLLTDYIAQGNPKFYLHSCSCEHDCCGHINPEGWEVLHVDSSYRRILMNIPHVMNV